NVTAWSPGSCSTSRTARSASSSGARTSPPARTSARRSTSCRRSSPMDDARHPAAALEDRLGARPDLDRAALAAAVDRALAAAAAGGDVDVALGETDSPVGRLVLAAT